MATTTAPVATTESAEVAATAAMTSTVATSAREPTIVVVTIAQMTGEEAAVEAAAAAAVVAAIATATARSVAVATPLAHSQEEAHSTLASAASPARTHVGTGPPELTPHALPQASALEMRTHPPRRLLPPQGKAPQSLPAAS